MTACRFFRFSSPLPRAATRSWSLGTLLVACGVVASPGFIASAAAQPSTAASPRPVTVARSLPPLTLSAAVLPNGAGTLTLNLPANTVLPDKVRVGLFEAGRPALVGDVTRRFSAAGNTLQTTLTIEGASPGRYEVRVVSGDKARTTLTQPAPLLVPGVEREPGWWIFNGSPIVPPAPTPSSAVETPATTPPTTTSLPLFIPGLRRDLSAKPKPVTRDLASTVPPNFKLWGLPSVLDLSQPDYDLSAFQRRLVGGLADAQAKGDVGYAGFVITMGSGDNDDVEVARAAIGRLQTLRNTVAPNAALILEIRNYQQNKQVIDAIAPLCDAIEITTNEPVLDFGDIPMPLFKRVKRDNGLWSVKVARRIAEDQPNYDLPIIYRDIRAREDGPSHSDLDALIGGANLLVGDNSTLDAVYQRNSPLFVGSVTLEDAGVFNLGSAERLRMAGRVPQSAQLIPIPSEGDKDKKPQPETFYASINSNTTAVQLEALRRSAAVGGRIYLEGSPDPASPIAARMKELGGGTLTPLPNGQGNTNTLLKLTDPWFFGTLRNTELSVTQQATVQLSTGSMAGQAKAQEGLDQLTSPRVVATLADGSPGMIVNPVGKGQVLWMPYAWSTTAPKDEAESTNRRDTLLRYDQAITGWLGPALVQLPPDAARALRVMVRRSAKGTLLVALTNSTNAPVKTPLTVGGAPTVCLDLLTEQDFPVKTSGFDGNATVTVPASGAVLLAFALDRKALEDERNAPRLKAKLK